MAAAEFGGLSRRGQTLTFTVTGEATPTEARSTVRTIRNGEVHRIGNLGRAETNRNPDADVEYGFVDLDQACADQIDTSTLRTGRPHRCHRVPPLRHGDDRNDDVRRRRCVEHDLVGRRQQRSKTLSLLPPLPGEVTADVAGQYGLPDCTIGETFLAEPVPTDVEVGPDGMLYVTTLAGEFPDAGAIFKIDPGDGTTTEVFTGLSTATGLAISRDGDHVRRDDLPGRDPEHPGRRRGTAQVRFRQPAGGAGDLRTDTSTPPPMCCPDSGSSSARHPSPRGTSDDLTAPTASSCAGRCRHVQPSASVPARECDHVLAPLCTLARGEHRGRHETARSPRRHDRRLGRPPDQRMRRERGRRRASFIVRVAADRRPTLRVGRRAGHD